MANYLFFLTLVHILKPIETDISVNTVISRTHSSIATFVDFSMEMYF